MSLRVGKVATAISASLLGVSLVCGCAEKPSTAVKVGDKSWSTKQVDEMADGCLKVFKEKGQKVTKTQAQNLVIQELVLNEFFKKIVSENSIKIDEKAKADLLNSSSSIADYYSDPACRPVAELLAENTVIQHTVPEQLFANGPSSFDVKVNPEYGSWSDSKGLVFDESRSLSTYYKTTDSVADGQNR